MLNKNYRRDLLKKINLIKKITLGIMGSCIILMITGVCILFYYAQTMNTMNFTIYLTSFVLVLLIVAFFFTIFFFRSYDKVINEMNGADLETLEKLSESRSWIEQYLPSFIIYSGKIIVFKFYHQPDLYFTDLTEISIRNNYFTRGKQNKMVIFKKSKGGSCFFSIDSNYLQQKHLLEKALEYNPKIIIKNS